MALTPGRRIVLGFETSQSGIQYRLVRFVSMSMPDDFGYVLESRREDAMGDFYWNRESSFAPRTAIATLLQMFVDKPKAST